MVSSADPHERLTGKQSHALYPEHTLTSGLQKNIHAYVILSALKPIAYPKSKYMHTTGVLSARTAWSRRG